MIKNVIQVTCDRCAKVVIDDRNDEGGLSENEPEWTTIREVGANIEIHLCPSCRWRFKLFMKNIAAPATDPNKEPEENAFGSDWNALFVPKVEDS